MYTPKQALEAARHGIAQAISRSRNHLVKLLQKHGAPVSADSSDHEVITNTLTAVKKQPYFRKDLHKLMVKNAKAHGKDLEFLGLGDGFFNFEGMPDTAPTTPTVTNPLQSATVAAPLANTKTSMFSSIFTPERVNSLFDTGLNVLSAQLTAKAGKSAQDTALAIEREKTAQALAAAEAAKNGGAAAAAAGGKKPMTTGMKIGIASAAVAVLGVTIFFIVRKKS